MKLGKKEMAARISQYQELYKGKVLFFTEDGNCFLTKSPAIDHAKKSGIKWMEVAPKGPANLDGEQKGDSKTGKKSADDNAVDENPEVPIEGGDDDLLDGTEKPE